MAEDLGDRRIGRQQGPGYELDRVQLVPGAVCEWNLEDDEVLLARGEAAEAKLEFEAALRRAPRRARSLLGLARACEALGDDAGAALAYADLARSWHAADEELADLAEVRTATGS